MPDIEESTIAENVRLKAELAALLKQTDLDRIELQREAAHWKEQHDALRQQIEDSKKQEPYAKLHDDGYFTLTAALSPEEKYRSWYAGWREVYAAPIIPPSVAELQKEVERLKVLLQELQKAEAFWRNAFHEQATFHAEELASLLNLIPPPGYRLVKDEPVGEVEVRYAGALLIHYGARLDNGLPDGTKLYADKSNQ